MIETLSKIKEAEAVISAEKEQFKADLANLSSNLQKELTTQKSQIEDEIQNYRQAQEKEAQAYFNQVKEENSLRFKTTSSSLDQSFVEKQTKVVGAVLKEVKEIYGRF